MQKIIKENSGVYLLELFAKHPFSITSKNFLGRNFEKGYYYYSGSAQKNLIQRLARHIAREKTIYWHIDYLTTHQDIIVKNIFIAESAGKTLECNFISTLTADFSLTYATKNFGNGDCKSCESHLLFSKKRLNHSHFISRYQSIVSLIPSSRFIF